MVEKLADFRKENYKKNSKWDFELFTIKCKKCGSEEVEFGGSIDHCRDAYYPEDCSIEGKLIIKCHGCGNAFTLDSYDLEKGLEEEDEQ